jgi:hypothetical protein
MQRNVPEIKEENTGLGVIIVRLEKVQKVLKEKGFPFTYVEEDGCGSVNFEYRGVVYHVWEFCEDGIWGAETNVRNIGRHEDISGDYETEIIDLIQKWK